MKMAELGKNVLVSCIIDFADVQHLPKTVLLESQYLQSYDNLLQILDSEIRKTVITLQILGFKQNRLSQS